MYTYQSVYIPGQRMPRGADDTRRRIVDAAYGLFYRSGFARVGVDDIAEAAGVTKRTLYYHFDSKDALVAAVLAIQDELMLARIRRWTDRTSGDPATIVESLFTEFAAWARRPHWRGSGFTRAAMEFAHLPGHPARVAARRHKAAVEDWLAERLRGKEARDARELARQIMLLIEGCHALILIHGEPGYAETAGDTARLLVQQWQLRREPRSRAPSQRR